MTEKVILGIDEVGRGPWAGPLVVGTVILGQHFQELTAESSLYQSLADSKQLSAKRRTMLAPLIWQHAAASATGWVSAAELDRYGLSASLKLATRRAVKQILAQNIYFSEIIIDGTVNFLQNTPLEDRVTTLKKADSLVKAVSAASIIAKVARDDYMIKLATQYPEYGFENHVGYGTKAHRAAIAKHGICPEHRLSFRPIAALAEPSSDRTLSPDTPKIASEAPNTTNKGQYAENLVADYLMSQKHAIIAHNFKTKTYEIDLISTKNDRIYFTEVKYRHNRNHGSALDQITPDKERQMRYAAQKFLSCKQQFKNLQPMLAVATVEGEPPAIKEWFTLQ